MPDTKISALMAGATPNGGDTTFPAVQGGGNVKITDAQLLAAILAAASTTEFIQDVVGALLAAGSGITVNYNDAGNVETIGLTVPTVVSASDPTVNDDTGDGYVAGTRWFNSTTGRTWLLKDASLGAAVWLRNGFAMHPGFVPGRWYAPYIGVRGLSGAMTAGNIRLIPYIPPSRITVSDLGVRITTVSAGGSVQCAIYASDSTGKVTGAPLGSTGSMSTTNLANVSAQFSGGNVTLEPGRLYWLAINSDNSVAACNAYSATMPIIGWTLGSTSQSEVNGSSSATTTVMTTAQAFGSWPDLTAVTPTASNSNLAVQIDLKAA